MNDVPDLQEIAGENEKLKEEAQAAKTQVSNSMSLQHFWGAEGAPILFSVLGIRMASCS